MSRKQSQGIAPPPPPRTGSVDEALQRAAALLDHDPTRAAAQADAILHAVPGHPPALLIRGAARARIGDLAGARAVLETLALTQPGAARVQAEWGALLSRLGDTEAAIAALTRAVDLDPTVPGAWRALADLLFLAGRSDAADAAYAQHLRRSVHDPVLMQAGDALAAGALDRAEPMLRAFLKHTPSDVAALRMLAEVATRLGRNQAAETLLQRCLELAPSFAGARHQLAVVLYRQNRAAEVLAHMERLAAEDPANAIYANLLAAALASTGEYARAIGIYQLLTEATPRQPRLWLGLGHALRTAGQREAAIAAYRTVIGLAPGMGEAWWSLANLKTGVLDATDVAGMRAVLDAAAGSGEDRYHLHYALGRALEDAGDHAGSFAQYAAGAGLRRAEVRYDAAATTAQIGRTVALFNPAFLAARDGAGCPDAAPIFIVGLPRSGSTLIEQMLASHPEVEGTMELPVLAGIAREIAGANVYPDCLAAVAPQEWRVWGERYLQGAASYRKTGRPRFVDKMPNNWVHAGLIALILPGARIIDARRHPMATCFSAWTQHFARGQHYSYDLVELGRYYRDYLALMEHIDVVLPGRVHRVQHEALVEQTEPELRRLLDYCGLGFDPACLAFHANPRAVRTASSEQVRRPIFRSGLDHWRQYEAWLDPLRQTLGQAIGEPATEPVP